jgi:hypothetical protein
VGGGTKVERLNFSYFLFLKLINRIMMVVIVT